ncbi:MAG: fumarate hydratase, partial [Deltaproteobacteria bacterium]|nr:fumarate hydratase [Deltaproteobacteria bacterium]
MREIPTEELYACVKRLFLETAFRLPPGVEADLHEALRLEASPQAADVLEILAENMRTAREDRIPLCQDTGLPQ